ncbi:hypothetical protein Pcinc_016010 [Petrolisthes cinctipes]|uniref:Uncharacterized protein n=1 Tax=Petrolisthes cinctipes TaxID=88211 RepID=A0AAE1KQ47_PETCI|nr:hypothetical protein Pcinc_016010 [Petrolisthes cinctipes]
MKRKSREGSTTYLWEFLLSCCRIRVLPQVHQVTNRRRVCSSWSTPRLCHASGDSTRNKPDMNYETMGALSDTTTSVAFWLRLTGRGSFTSLSMCLRTSLRLTAAVPRD